MLSSLTALFSASSSSQGDGDDGVISAVEEGKQPGSGDEIAVGAASEASSSSVAAAIPAAAAAAATSGGGVGESGDRSVADDTGVGEDGGGAVVVGPGISWTTLSAVVASQLGLVGLVGWISSSAIRECSTCI